VQPAVLGSLSGFVFNEVTNAPQSGVLVTLTGINSLGQTVTLTTTTAASGSYSFAGLGAGTYTITETPPSGFFDDQNTVGSLGGTTVRSNPTISGIVLGSGANGVSYDFGNIFAGS
jgi:large repetitive protein